jgi:MFS family permease
MTWRGGSGGPRPGYIVAALCTGTALSALNSGMIAVSLSTLRTEFALDVATVTWVITVFYLTSAVLQPVMGRLADHYGPRRIFTFGMITVAIAGAGGALAPSFGWLCAARVLLAVGTAATFPSAAAMLRSIDGRPGIRAQRLIARVQLIDTSTAAIGPVVGGTLIVLFGWEALFWINIPLAALALVSTRLLLPRDAPRAHVSAVTILRESDVPGVLAFATAIVALLVFLLEVPSGVQWYLLAVAVAAGTLFAWWELRARTPFIDLQLLAAHPALLRVYGLYVIGNIVLYGTLFGIPQYLEDHAGYGTAAVGAMLVPLAAFNAALARPIEKVISGRGARFAMLIGAAGLVASAVALPLLSLNTQLWLVLMLMAGIGIPFAFLLVSLTQSLYAAAPPAIVGQAAGLFQTARSLGCIAAAAVVGVSLTGGTDPEDWVILSAVIAVFAVLLLAVTALTGRARVRSG